MSSSGTKARIVVVDDAVFMRRHLREILEAGGYEVVAEGEDGAQVLELYERHAPDLVTLDVEMPRMTGLEALRELRGCHPEARVIICSSVSHETALLEAVGAGARDYVLKPVSSEKLLDAVAKALK